ncbi:MAG: glycosyltransferase family A protein [Gemmatimonadota bacterium]
MSDGAVSVIIPMYNAERYVAEAVESVLTQTLRPKEVIVVDDGSTDRGHEVIAQFRDVRYVHQDNAGTGPARNTGVALAQGEFLAFLDADDLWEADKLAWQVATLRADTSLDMVFGFVEQFPSPELADEIERTILFAKEPAPAYFAGTMLIRRSAFDRAGPFPSHLTVGEFIDWYLRAIDAGLTSVMHPRVVLRRRIHNTNMGITQRGAQKDYVRIIKATLDRRRRNA